MFVIVYNNSVILGPMRWNRFRFENEIQEECDFSCTLPDRNDQLAPITVSSSIKILPVELLPDPEYNSRIQILNGPFWEFMETKAIGSYQPEYMQLDAAKNLLKAEVAAERWNKENAGVLISINENQYSFSTDKETRATLQSSSNLDGVNWKLAEDNWVQLTKEETQSVLNQILAYVQACFDWEFNKLEEIYACATLEQLSAIVVKEE